MMSKRERRTIGLLIGLWITAVSGWVLSSESGKSDKGKAEASSEDEAQSTDTFKETESSDDDDSTNEDSVDANSADDESSKEGAKKERQKGEKWGGRLRDHAKQGFVNILAGTGYFLVAPYEKDDPEKRCGNDAEDPTRGEPVCSGRVGWHLDMLAGYGIKRGLELFLMFRLGLEQPDSNGLMNQPKTRQIGLGIKVFTPKDGFFKLGFGVAPLIDFSDRGESVDILADLVIHVPIQALFDIFPWFGAYAQIAPNISFIQEFRVEFTGGVGVQGRFP
jgi:hypothetical protein